MNGVGGLHRLFSPGNAPEGAADNGSAREEDEVESLFDDARGSMRCELGEASSSGKRSSVLAHQRNPHHSIHEANNHKRVEESAAKSTFVDAAAMKEKVRQNLSKPQHVVSDYYKDFGICQLIARSSRFDRITLIVIGLNACWIAVDTDNNTAQLLLDAHPVFILAENIFCAFFAFEWFVRFMSFRRKRDGFKDMWFIFDSFLVSIMVIETWCFTMYTFFLSSSGVGRSGGSGGGSTGVIKVARLLRLSRMARMARLLRAMPELMIMIKGMLAATRSVFFTLCLLFTIMYIFGIAFTQMASEFDVGKKFFSGVMRSMFTLLLYGTFLDGVGVLSEQLLSAPFYLSVMFFVFVLVGSLTVMNMLVGVLCEVVSAVAATEQEEMLVTYVNDKLSKVMSLLDQDGGGTISKKEFIEILDNVDAVRCLNDVGVDVFGLVDLADYIFEDDDSTNEDEVELDFSKFMEVVLQLRGTNQATVKDIVDLRKFMRMAMQENYKQTQMILEQLQMHYEGTIRVDETQSLSSGAAMHTVPAWAKAAEGEPGAKAWVNTENKLLEIPRGHVPEAVPYEVEGGHAPQLPQATTDGQLLRNFGMELGFGGAISSSAVAPASGVQVGEGLVLKGDWCPCEMEIPSRGWRMPGEDEPPSMEFREESTRGRFPSVSSDAVVEAVYSDATAIDVTPLLANAGRKDDPHWVAAPKGGEAHHLLGTWEASSLAPKVGQVVTVAAREPEGDVPHRDTDMEALRSHVDKLCRHLQTGLSDLLHQFQAMHRDREFKKVPNPPNKYESSNPACCKL